MEFINKEFKIEDLKAYFATGAEAREKAKKAREEEKNKKEWIKSV